MNYERLYKKQYGVRRLVNISQRQVWGLRKLFKKYNWDRYAVVEQLIEFGERILDIGCGERYLLRRLKDKFEEIYGLDSLKGVLHSLIIFFLKLPPRMGEIGLIILVCFLGSVCGYRLRWLMHSVSFDPQARAIGLTVLVVALTLLVEKQFSYGLTMHKDLFAFLGLVVNFPLIAYRIWQPAAGAEEET